MRFFQRSKNRGFTLVELMIVVAIIGVLAALAIYGVRRYLASAKTSEAKNSIGAISRGAVGAFESESTAQQLLDPSGSTGAAFTHDLCQSATTPVPENMSAVAGTKYQPANTDAAADFNTGDSTSGWKCLKFQMSSPIYYQYDYQANTLGGGAAIQNHAGILIAPDPGFVASAQGNLDGDTDTYSTFGQRGGVDADTKTLNLATQLEVVDEFE